MKISFTFDTEYGVFSDAITLEDTHTHTAEEIEAMKQERLDNWIAIITTPSIAEEQIQDIVEENI